MRAQKKWIYLLVLAAALSVGGCGSPGPVRVTIGDPAVSQELKKNVTIISPLGQGFDLYGNPPTRQKVRIFGELWENPNYPSSNRVVDIGGNYIQISAQEDGFQFAREDGTVLYGETGYQGATNFKFHRLSTTDPELRLWVVAGPNKYPSLVWLLGETKDGITAYLTPDDISKAGISIEKTGTERLAINVEEGALTLEKLHMEKVEPAKRASSNGGMFELGKIAWKSDKKVAAVWDNKEKKFVPGSAPSKETGQSAGGLFGSTGSISENKILSIGERKTLSRRQGDADSKWNILALTASNGKEMKFVAYPGFFKITSADEAVAYYTSEPMDWGSRFYVSEISVSDPDTRAWSVMADSTGTSWWNPGFWLIGEHKGDFRVYITPSDMARAGLAPLSRTFPEGYRAHRLYLTPEDGVIHAAMSYEFWPPRASHASAKQILDRTFAIAWDKDAQGFVLKDVAVPETPAYAVYDEGAHVASWQIMTEEEQKQMQQQLWSIRFAAGRQVW